jgi:hypothetical protein
MRKDTLEGNIRDLKPKLNECIIYRYTRDGGTS